MQKFLEGMVCFLTEIPERACLLIGMIGGEGETGGSEWGTVKGRASRERRETGVCRHVGTMAAYWEEEEELPQLRPRVGGWAAGGGHSVVSPAP